MRKKLPGKKNFVSDETALAGGAHLVFGTPVTVSGDYGSHATPTPYFRIGSAYKQNLAATCDGVYLIAIYVASTAPDRAIQNGDLTEVAIIGGGGAGGSIITGTVNSYRRYYNNQYSIRASGCPGSTLKVKVGCWLSSGKTTTWDQVRRDHGGPDFTLDDEEFFPPHSAPFIAPDVQGYGEDHEVEITLAEMDWTQILSNSSGFGPREDVDPSLAIWIAAWAKVILVPPGDYRYENKYFHIPIPDMFGRPNAADQEVDWRIPADMAAALNGHLDIPSADKSTPAFYNPFDIQDGISGGSSPRHGSVGPLWPETWHQSGDWDNFLDGANKYFGTSKFCLTDRVNLMRNGSLPGYKDFGARKANSELYYCETAIAEEPPASCTTNEVIYLTLKRLDHRTGLLITNSEFLDDPEIPTADGPFMVCSGNYVDSFGHDHCEGFAQLVSEEQISPGIWKYGVKMKKVGHFHLTCAAFTDCEDTGHGFIVRNFSEIANRVKTRQIIVTPDEPHYIAFIRKDIRDADKMASGAMLSMVGEPLLHGFRDFVGAGPRKGSDDRNDYVLRHHPIEVAILDVNRNLCTTATNVVSLTLSVNGHNAGAFAHIDGVKDVTATEGIARFDQVYRPFGLGRNDLTVPGSHNDNFYIEITSPGLVPLFTGIGGDVIGPFTMQAVPKFLDIGPFKVGELVDYRVMMVDLYGEDALPDNGEALTLVDGDILGRSASGFTGAGSASVTGSIATFRGSFPTPGTYYMHISGTAGSLYACLRTCTPRIEVIA
jgi:hypothetical protein